MNNRRWISKAVVATTIMVVVIGLLFIGGCAPKPTTTTPQTTEVINLIFDDDAQSTTTIMARTNLWFCEQVEARTNGRVTFTHYYMNSLTKGAECLDGVSSGVSDVATLICGYNPQKHFLNQVPFAVPFGPEDNVLALSAWNQLREACPEVDAESEKFNVKVLFPYVLGPYILEAKTPIHTLEDLQGKKILISGEWGAKMIESLGAVPLGLPTPERYVALQTVAADGSVLGYDISLGFKLYELCKYTTLTGFGSWMAGLCVINMDTWDSLPKDIQEIMIEVGKEASEWQATVAMEEDLATRQRLEAEEGVTFYELPFEERVRWANAMPNLPADYVDMGEEMGLPARKVMDNYLRLCEESGHNFPREWSIP